MLRNRIIGVVTLMPLLFLAGCATPVTEPERTGFLSDYSGLEKIDDKQWFYSAGKTDQYQRFHIEPIVMGYEESETDPMFAPEEIDELKLFIHEQLSTQLSEDDGYEIVDQPGPGVASFRIAITDLDASNGWLNATIYTKVTGAGLGGIALEGELVDAESKEQLAASIRWGTGSRILRAGFTRLGDAKILVKRWSKDIRKKIDAANGVE